MRWSKAVISSSVLALMFSMTACKQESVGTTPKRAKLVPAGTTVKQTPRNASDVESTTIASSPTAQACYQELCVQQNELSYKNYLQIAQTGSEELKKYYQQYILPKVKETLVSSQTSLQTHLELLQKKESLLLSAQLTTTQEQLVVVMLFLTDKLGAEQSSIVQKNIPAELGRANAVMQTHDDAAFIQHVQQNSDLDKAVQAEALHIEKIQNELNKLLGGDLFDFVGEPISRIAKGESYQIADLKRLAHSSYALRLIQSLLSGPMGQVFADPKFSKPDFSALFRELRIQDKILERKSKASQILQSCEIRYYQSMNLAPSNEQLTEFKTLSEKVRQTVIETLPPSDEGREAVAKANLYFPQERSSLNTSWSNELARQKALADRQNTSSQALDDSALLAYLIFSGISYTPDYSFCDDFVDLSVSDAATAVNRAVKVSAFSIMRPDYGISILAHELAHIASFESGNLENTKMCLTKKQDTDLYVAEDYADIIAAKVSTRLQNELDFKQKNLGCFLADAYSTISLKNDDPTDKHSSGLYRALQIAQVRKEALPASCTALVKAEAPKALNVCE